MFPQHSLGRGGHAEMIERLKIVKKNKDIAKATTDVGVEIFPQLSVSTQSICLVWLDRFDLVGFILICLVS